MSVITVAFIINSCSLAQVENNQNWLARLACFISSIDHKFNLAQPGILIWNQNISVSCVLLKHLWPSAIRCKQSLWPLPVGAHCSDVWGSDLEVSGDVSLRDTMQRVLFAQWKVVFDEVMKCSEACGDLSKSLWVIFLRNFLNIPLWTHSVYKNLSAPCA